MVVLQELNNMFWGLTINSGKRYSQHVDKAFHVSMAALQIDPEAPQKGGLVQVMIRQESGTFLLCTLKPGSLLQQPLDLQFSAGESVEFFLNGEGVVHLTGSLMEEEDDFADDYSDGDYDSESDAPDLMPAGDDDDDDESDEDWEPQEESVGSKRKASSPIHSKRKKLKITELDGEEEDDEDEEEEYDSSFIDDETLEDDMEESEDVEEEEEEEGEDADSLVKEAHSKSLNTPTSPTKKDKSSSETPSPKKKKKKGKTPKEQPTTPEASDGGDHVNGEAASKKKKKKKKKKKNDEDKSTPQQASDTDTAVESPAAKPAPPVGKKRTVAGGTCVEDIKIGHGPEAKPGKTVSVYYSGMLAKSNKRFDSCLGGKPFRLRLGRGEVIKGWDTGLIGMRVGGKRKITVPPSQGYGNSRQGPIPPGSTLIFDVELKAVS